MSTELADEDTGDDEADKTPAEEPKVAEKTPLAQPPSEEIQSAKGKRVVYTPPAKGGVWPWPVGQFPPQADSKPVSLTQDVDKDHFARGAAVSPAAGKAVVVTWETKFKEKTRSTFILWADLATGSVTHRWKINELYAPFDLHADGLRFLLRANGGVDKTREVLELATVTDEGLQRRQWEPSRAWRSGAGQHDADHVRWAGFVGEDYVAAVCGDGVLSVWHLAGLKNVGVFKGVRGYPTVTPDGQRLALATEDHILLLDPAAGEIIGARRLPDLPNDPVLAFNPAATTLACAGSGRVAFLDLEHDRAWNTVIPELQIKKPGLVPDFGWAGNKHLYHNGELYDLHMPIAVWRYDLPLWASPRGPVVWAVTPLFGAKSIALRSFELPHPGVQVGVTKAMQKGSLFSLRPGDDVSVDVAGVPADRQQEVSGALRRRAEKSGYRFAAAAPVVFLASVDATAKEKTITYRFGNPPTVCPYEERQAHLKIVKDGRVLWKASGSVSPPLLLKIPPGTDVRQHVKNCYGAPDYSVFSDHPLPGVIRNDQVKGVLGTSDMTPSGIRDR